MAVASQLSAEDPASKNAVAIEALSRLKGMDLEANPALKAAVLRVLSTTKGTPQFVELVRDFKLSDQGPALLDYASSHSTDSSTVDALRLLVENGSLELVKAGLKKTNAPVLLEVIANSAEKIFVPLVEPLVSETNVPSIVRKRAVQALAATQDGAKVLLKLAKEDRLPADVKLITGAELSKARWSGIKEEAAGLLPLPQSQNAEPLPPIAELAKMKGDATKGAEVFARPLVGCINCHQVNGKGVNFAPNLSEIGTKLGKDALFEAILDPSAGISFGFEAWQIEFTNGEEAFGILLSDTADEITLKTQNGITSKYKKADIASRTQMKTSIMPAGLQLTMSQQDLVDLVEYLSTLKKSTGH
jgi:putative heme-binding domain-containing protein